MSAAGFSEYSFDSSRSEAELMLAYASERGITVTPSDIDAILKVVRANGGPATTLADEGAFWAAFARLSQAVSPTTVQSLRATNQLIRTRTLIFGGEQNVPVAQEAVRRYRGWAIAAVVLLGLVQIYAVVGSSVLKTIDDLDAERKKVVATLQTKKSELAAKQADAAIDPDVKALEATKQTKSDDLRASLLLLGSWNAVWRAVSIVPSLMDGLHVAASWVHRDTTPEPAGTDDVPNEHLDVVRARIALDAVRGFVLPVLFGWVGACAFILRRLSDEIAKVTYSLVSESAYRLRMPLGALAGLGIVWLLNPTGEPPPATTALPSLTALSTNALAFLSGYSVEVLFSLMDAIIGAFSQTTKKS